MSISASLLPEFDQEMANLRKTLERVPDGKFDWKPHPKSNNMGWLANHLANLPSWVIFTLSQDSLDVMPAGGDAYKEPKADNTAGVVAQLDKNVAAARQALQNATDEQLLKTWSLLKGGQQIFALPRVAVLRSMIMNHMIHHRAQMTVYLRMNDVPVPALYGPSADEGSF
jgi:uncharacterized damage-inducible protein DinB